MTWNILGLILGAGVDPTYDSDTLKARYQHQQSKHPPWRDHHLWKAMVETTTKMPTFSKVKKTSGGGKGMKIRFCMFCFCRGGVMIHGQISTKYPMYQALPLTSNTPKRRLKGDPICEMVDPLQLLEFGSGTQLIYHINISLSQWTWHQKQGRSHDEKSISSISLVPLHGANKKCWKASCWKVHIRIIKLPQLGNSKNDHLQSILFTHFQSKIPKWNILKPFSKGWKPKNLRISTWNTSRTAAPVWLNNSPWICPHKKKEALRLPKIGHGSVRCSMEAMFVGFCFWSDRLWVRVQESFKPSLFIFPRKPPVVELEIWKSQHDGPHV